MSSNFRLWAVAVLLLALSMTSACMGGVVGFPCLWCDISEPDRGITNVGTTADGTLHAGGKVYGQFLSRDGGLTWSERSDRTVGIEWGKESADTPRGRYVIEGPHILQIDPDGRSNRVYSTTYLWEPGNVWVQKTDSELQDVGEVTTEPNRMVYHQASGNLVLAMGRQGIVVGTPDGQWKRTALGPYSPSDFSFAGKTRLLLSRTGFWAMITLLLLSMTGAALIFIQHPAGDWRPRAFAPPCAIAALGLWGAAIIFGLLLNPSHVVAVVLYGLILLVLVLVSLAVVRVPEQGEERRWFAVSVGALAVAASLHLVAFFGTTLPDNYLSAIRVTAIGVPGFIFGITALALSLRERGDRLAIVSAFAGMIVAGIVVFMLWLHLGVWLILVKSLAMVLTAAIAFALYRHMKRVPPGEDTDTLCQVCQTPNSFLAKSCYSCGSPLAHDTEPSDMGRPTR